MANDTEPPPDNKPPTDPTKIAHDRDRAQRWQKISIDHLGYSLNLVLAFTVALLGYWFTLLSSDQFRPGSTAKCTFLLSLSGLLLAGLFGLVCVVVRVYDFRWTARRAAKNPTAPALDEVRMLDSWVRGLFVAQFTAFALGVASLAATLLLMYGGKLR